MCSVQEKSSEKRKAETHARSLIAHASLSAIALKLCVASFDTPPQEVKVLSRKVLRKHLKQSRTALHGQPRLSLILTLALWPVYSRLSARQILKSQFSHRRRLDSPDYL